MRKKLLSLFIVALMMLQTSLFAFAQDPFFVESPANYSLSMARTKEQCQSAYAYLSTVIDTRYTQRVYDILFRAQFRLSLFGGKNWIYLNEGDATTMVKDSVLGDIAINASRGCNAYARFASKYIRGLQGPVRLANDYLGRPKNYVPNAEEIKSFVEAYVDVGERILTGYLNDSLQEIRPHSLCFLGEDPQKEGFYFCCQDGDGHGQTLRYFSYQYMATRLRYNPDYGYALALGDTNSGKDKVPDDTLFGAVDAEINKNLHFSEENGYGMNITGWALSKTNSPVRVCCYVDGEYAACANAVPRPEIHDVFPVWDTGESGFSLSMDMSAFCTGNHVLEIYAEDGAERVRLKSVNFFVDNLVYEIESPDPSESVVLRPGAMKAVIEGWGFDRSGTPASFLYSVDGGARHSLTPQERTDIAEGQGLSYSDVGFSLPLDFTGMPFGTHTVELFMNCKGYTASIETISVTITDEPDLSKTPVRLQIMELPDQLEYDFAESVRLDGLVLEIGYDDGTSAMLRKDFVYSAATNVPGRQTVRVIYGGLTAEFQIFVRDPIAPQEVSLLPESNIVTISRSMQLTPTITPRNAQGYTVIWESRDPSVASISEDGVVTGVSRGECEIVAVVFDYYGNEIGSDSTVLRVCSAFESFWIRLWQRILRWFSVRLDALFGFPAAG